MPYVTLAQLIERYGEPALVAVTDVAEFATGVVNEAKVARAIADADAVIDGYLAKRGYALPLQPVHRLVTAWCRAIARYHLHKNRLAPDGKDPIERAWRDALRLLQQVADGKFALGAGDPVAVHKLDARFDSAPLVFGRKQLRSWR